MSGAMTAPMADKSTEKPLLQVHNLSVDFTVQGRTVRAVKHIAFEIGQGETVALVGARCAAMTSRSSSRSR